MLATPRPLPPRRLAAFRLVLLLALAPIGGCECTNSLPFTPNPLPPLSAVVLSPTTDTLRVGEVRVFTAIAYDDTGAAIPGAGFTWTSSDPNVFTVVSGRVTGVGEGSALLFAEAGGRRDSATVFVYASSGWLAQTSHTSRNLNGVFFYPDGREGWAVGAAGTIMHTTDAGQSWRAQTSRTTANLNGVWFAHPDSGWAVGNSGTVLVTPNRGATWTRRTLGFGENLMDVCFANRDTGFAVGSAGAVLRTVDGGRTWQKQNLSGFVFQSVSFSSTQEGWLVGDGGEIFGTDDAGETWSHVQPSITGQSLRGVWRNTTWSAWAVGAQGQAPRTREVGGAAVWEAGNAGALNQFEAVQFPTDSLVGYAVGYSSTGLVLKSEDGGLGWTRQTSNTSRKLNDVYFVDALRGWAVGDAGTIIHTALGGP